MILKALMLTVLFAHPLALPAQAQSAVDRPTCLKPWVFFDLGNTLVIHREGTPSRYAPGAKEYINELKRRGFQIGLITNVPIEWGPTSQEKIEALRRLLADSWSRGPDSIPMDWEDFPENRILVPNAEAERKPAPFLFQSALALVSHEENGADCKVVFQGEAPDEVQSARDQGITAYLVDSDPATPFMPIELLERL